MRDCLCNESAPNVSSAGHPNSTLDAHALDLAPGYRSLTMRLGRVRSTMGEPLSKLPPQGFQAFGGVQRSPKRHPTPTILVPLHFASRLQRVIAHDMQGPKRGASWNVLESAWRDLRHDIAWPWQRIYINLDLVGLLARCCLDASAANLELLALFLAKGPQHLKA